MSWDIEGQPLSTVVFDGKNIIMGDGTMEQEEGGQHTSGHVQRGNGARVDVIKRQRSFMEKLIGVRNAQCELYLANVHRSLDKHATSSVRSIQSKANQVKYDYKRMQVSAQRNELEAKKRQDPSTDIQYDEFLLNQAEKYLIYNPNQCTYVDKSMKYPTRSAQKAQLNRISPALAKARKLLQDYHALKNPEKDNSSSVSNKEKRLDSQHDRNVRFEIEDDEQEETERDGDGKIPCGSAESITQDSTVSGLTSNSNNSEYNKSVPIRLFKEPQKGRTKAEITMENFKKRIQLRHMLEKMEMAPYQVLLDENKDLPPSKFPDPLTLWDKEGHLYGLSDKQRLQRRPLNQAVTQKPAHLPMLHSKSDCFMRDPLDSDQRSLGQSHRALSVQSERAHLSRGSTSTFSMETRSEYHTSATPSRSIRARPFTHAMLRKEKSEIDVKLNTFLDKLNTKRKTLSYTENDTQREDSLENDQVNESPKVSPKQPVNPTNNTKQTPRRTPAPKRGVPHFAAQRSERHTATFKLRQVVASLVKSKSKMELLELDKLRDNENKQDGENDILEQAEEIS